MYNINTIQSVQQESVSHNLCLHASKAEVLHSNGDLPGLGAGDLTMIRSFCIFYRSKSLLSLKRNVNAADSIKCRRKLWPSDGEHFANTQNIKNRHYFDYTPLLHTKVVSVMNSTYLNKIHRLVPSWVINPARWPCILGVKDLVLVLTRASHLHLHLHLQMREAVWVSSCLLHASWEFLFPILCRDPCLLILQFLLDVLLLALLVEHRVIVAGGRQKVQYLQI